MIELNLLEKKEKFKMPVVLGMDFSHLNLPMIFIAIIIFYVPEIFVRSYFEKGVKGEEDISQELSKEISKLDREIGKNAGLKSQLQAYNEQVEKLKARSVQVDEILKIKTNPKKVLEKIARSIPDDASITEIRINEDKDIYISGTANSARSIGEFITLMNDSPFFGNTIAPTKQEGKEDKFDGVVSRIEYFDIKGKIKNYDMRSK